MKNKTNKPCIPQPAHAYFRKEPLPWCVPKSAKEDPECPSKLELILNSSSYVPAIEDVSFLGGDDARGVRLQLDYLKTDKILRQHGIKHTIVVFGSTRIIETSAAKEKVKKLKNDVLKKPGNKALQKQLHVAERILEKSRYYDVARQLSQHVSNASKGSVAPQLVVMTGGGPGIMEAANRGADDTGTKTIGLNITLPHEQYPNPYVTPDLCFQFHYFSLRKMHFILRARALVAFPGGFGTFDELFETLTLIQTRKIKPIPVILVGEKFWRKAFNIDFLVDEGVIDNEDRDLFWFAETADDIWNGLQDWYVRNSDQLMPDD